VNFGKRLANEEIFIFPDGLNFMPIQMRKDRAKFIAEFEDDLAALIPDGFRNQQRRLGKILFYRQEVGQIIGIHAIFVYCYDEPARSGSKPVIGIFHSIGYSLQTDELTNRIGGQ
jgi:hypothetical protein